MPCLPLAAVILYGISEIAVAFLMGVAVSVDYIITVLLRFIGATFDLYFKD